MSNDNAAYLLRLSKVRSGLHKSMRPLYDMYVELMCSAPQERRCVGHMLALLTFSSTLKAAANDIGYPIPDKLVEKFKDYAVTLGLPGKEDNLYVTPQEYFELIKNSRQRFKNDISVIQDSVGKLLHFS